MCTRYLGFLLLVWFPGVLHGQSAPQSCSAPILNGGFLVPKQDVYSGEATVRYSCDKGLKPAVGEGWWVTSKCLNGAWSPKPQCIDKKACIPPDIPNAKPIANQHGWFEKGHIIFVTCNKGFETKSQLVTCGNGAWTPVPVCEKSVTACDAPPQIPHAVIIHQGYQEVFAAGSKVQYECEEGYTADSQKTITCRAGEWTQRPMCSAPRAGSAQVEPVGGPATSGGGSSSSSGVNYGDESLRAPLSRCGDVPVVPNAVVVEEKRTFVKYKCNVHYTQVGPEIVYCHSDGRWTPRPSCEEPAVPSCEVDSERYRTYLRLSAVVRIPEGQERVIPCVYGPNYFSRVQCYNGQIYVGGCEYFQ